MRFKEGQRVLCTNSHYNTVCRYPLIQGEIYTVEGFYQCPCGSRQVALREIAESIQTIKKL